MNVAGEPGRVLLLSAPVGEGHVAAARALAARMRAVWPGVEVHEVEHTGPRNRVRDALLAASYGLSMRFAPGLYGFGYDLGFRHPRFIELVKEVFAERLGRTLAPLLARERPDLVVSTYPMTSGGLAWLRKRGRLPGRSVAVVTDVAVHPFWVWPELDETWTLLPSSQAQARSVAPGANVRVMPAVVDPHFHPGDPAEGRAALGLRDDAFVVLVSGGSLAFGGLERHVDAALAADDPGGEDVQVVVLCGHNERLRARLEARGLPRERLVAMPWTDRMDDVLRAADVVVTTAGGMIATEALAVGRPVLFAAPVPGHGRAGAAMTADAGLALVCPEPADLTATISRLRGHSREWAELAEHAEAFGRADLDVELAALARRVWGSDPETGPLPPIRSA